MLAVLKGGLAYVPIVDVHVKGELTLEKYMYASGTYEQIKCYFEQGNKMFVPRGYAASPRFKVKNVGSMGKMLAHIDTKRPMGIWGGVNQQEFVENVVKNTQRNDLGGVAIAPCGCGKTLMGLEIIRRLGLTTLVIVSREYQITQWQDEADASYLNLKLGVYRGKNKLMPDSQSPIVIGIINSLHKEKNLDFFNSFGLVIFDECHHVPAKTWLEVFCRLRSRYIIGMTAGLSRTDGLDSLFGFTLGGVVATALAAEIKSGLVWQIVMPPVPIKTVTRMTVAKSLMKSNMRNEILAKVIKKMFQNNRDIFVFGDIKKHLIKLKDICERIGIPSAHMGCYFASITKDEAVRVLSLRIIFITYQMASEGFNIPRKDCIICATPPISNLKQLRGRISREYRGKPDPVLIDPVDVILREKAEKRVNSWEMENLKVKKIDWRIIK